MHLPTQARDSVVSWRADVDELVGRLHRDVGELPYDPTPERLYCAADLYAGFEGGFANTVDQQIYARARAAGGPMLDPTEEIVQRLHDHGISLALEHFRRDRTLVGVMGGHAMVRGSAVYRSVVELGRQLARAGFCVTTGGGPGAMEAANLGAASAHLELAVVDEIVAELAMAPSFEDDPTAFVGVALAMAGSIEAQGGLATSLAVPTWFYGHEPSNPFASHLAKYFSNSEREAGLLAIADGGIVYVPGGPGTMQEVFQDAAQNAYRTFGGPFPMVFLDPPDDPDWWQLSGILTALDQVFIDGEGEDRPGRELLCSASSVADVVAALVHQEVQPSAPGSHSGTVKRS
ncbi:MAG: hypothetical protein R2733_03805 [Acidimicrobiales bacterium]